MVKKLDARTRAAPTSPSPIPIATWDDAFRLLDQESMASERHLGKLPIDQEFDHLRKKGGSKIR
jgi:hypothetical protein